MNTLTRPKRSAKNHPVMAFDVETVGPSREFVCGCFRDVEGQHYTTSRPELVSWLTAAKNIGAIVYATNLFYDFTATFGGFPAPARALFSGARLIRVNWKVPGKGTIRFYDTSNLTNRMSVKVLGKMVGLTKLEMPEVLLSEDRGDLTSGLFDPVRMEQIEEYNRRDTEITYQWALRFQEVCKELGCEVKTTIASTALDLWKRRYMQKRLLTPPRWMNEWFREAYHGGLVFVFKRGLAKGVTYYDIRSLYPYVLADRDYPDCGSLHFVRGALDLKYIMEYEGFSRCVVDYPHCYFPILPVVVKGCLLSCTGVYSGMWTHVELREALKRGAKIIEIQDTCYFTRTIRPLKVYMQQLYKQRLAAKESGDEFETVYKLFMNALSGKFGQRYDGDMYEPLDVEGISDPQELEGVLTIASGDREYYVKPVTLHYNPDFVNVAWAAYMTAYARLKEIEYLEEAFPNVFACDTDSVFTTYAYAQGDDLGDMGIKEGKRDWMFLFPKQYASWDSDGAWSGKVKGVPIAGQDVFIRQGSYTWSKPATFKEAMREGVSPGDWIVRTRTDKAKHDKRVFLDSVDPRSGLTDSRPFTYEEAVDYFEYPPAAEDWRVTGILPLTDPAGPAREAFRKFEARVQIAALRGACTLPSRIIFKVWDYKRGIPRRVRSRSGQLMLWHEGVVDETATEQGYGSAESFINAVRAQVLAYEQIHELEGSI